MPSFAGRLATPIKIKLYVPTLVGLSEHEVQQKNTNAQLTALKISLDKLNLLFGHYGLEKTGVAAADYFYLALRLAQEFVPGFELKFEGYRGRGRPPRYDAVFLMRLLADVQLVQRLKRQTGAVYSDRRAIKELTTNTRFKKRWADFRGREATLQNLLSKAKKPKFNPAYPLIAREDHTGRHARDALIECFSVTNELSPNFGDGWGQAAAV